MRHVVPYFGTPRRLLSDRGREFISAIWMKLLHSPGIQQVLTSPYHPEGNEINEWSHSTLNNMLRARLLEGPSTKAWVDKIPGIMLTLNAMPHEPHGFSTSMVATGREPTLPPDLTSDTGPTPAVEDTPEYVETIRQWLQLTHQQMTAPPAAPLPNPYREGSLAYVLTTPPERTSKLAPRWKGPFHICRIPKDYQVTYEDDGVERTVHVNHVKPTNFAAPDLPEPVPPVEYHTRRLDTSLPASLISPPNLLTYLLPLLKPPWHPSLPQPPPKCPLTPLLQFLQLSCLQNPLRHTDALRDSTLSKVKRRLSSPAPLPARLLPSLGLSPDPVQ